MQPTRTLADFVSTSDDVPPWVLHESKRALVNLLAVSLSAAAHPSSRTLARWARDEAAAPRATVLGSDLRTSPALAAQVNGFLAHLQDYDDTHLPTVLHPSAPVWPAVLAAGETVALSGREALVAFALGAEAACRIAMSVHPWHYDRGWHITGTVGVLGAAAGAGRALGLDSGRLVHALGLAGTQAAGVREVFGSDGKALHAAKAAGNGVQAAQLARAGFTAGEEILAGRRGFWAVLSPDGHDEAALLAGLGEEWELRRNGLKPYANGVVAHPVQDAVIRLRNEHGLQPDDVASIEARVCPLVLELMDRRDPRAGLEAKFSFQHCAAAALVNGAGHDAQFSDEKARDPLIASLRSRVSAVADPSLSEDEAVVTVVLVGDRRVEAHVEHASGSRDNPLSDEALGDKFRALVSPVLGATGASRLLEAAWRVDDAPAVGDLLALTTP